jgi:hypothetical protein
MERALSAVFPQLRFSIAELRAWTHLPGATSIWLIKKGVAMLPMI